MGTRAHFVAGVGVDELDVPAAQPTQALEGQGPGQDRPHLPQPDQADARDRRHALTGIAHDVIHSANSVMPGKAARMAVRTRSLMTNGVTPR